jgi:hypothetical protein
MRLASCYWERGRPRPHLVPGNPYALQRFVSLPVIWCALKLKLMILAPINLAKKQVSRTMSVLVPGQVVVSFRPLPTTRNLWTTTKMFWDWSAIPRW